MTDTPQPDPVPDEIRSLLAGRAADRVRIQRLFKELEASMADMERELKALLR